MSLNPNITNINKCIQQLMLTVATDPNLSDLKHSLVQLNDVQIIGNIDYRQLNSHIKPMSMETPAITPPTAILRP